MRRAIAALPAELQVIASRNLERYSALDDAQPVPDDMVEILARLLACSEFAAGVFIIEEARFALELDPTFPEAHWLLAAVHAQQGQLTRALEEFELYEELYGEPQYWFRGYLKALAGQRDDALRDLAELERRVASGPAAGRGGVWHSSGIVGRHPLVPR